MKRSCPKGKNIHTPNTYQRRGIAWAAIYLQVYFVCFNKTKAGAGARLVKACCVLAESQAAWKCQGNHTQHSEGSAHSWRREWSRGWEMDEKKQQGGKEREKPVKILHSKLRLSLAVAVSPAGHPSLSLCLSLSRRFISMVSDSSGKYGILCREGKHKQKPTGIPINL